MVMKNNSAAVSAEPETPIDRRAQLLRKLLQRDIRPAPAIEPVPRPAHAWPLRLPASASQRRLWFIDQMGVGAKAYYVSATLTFTGQLDPAVLRRALDALVQRHESLRTTFVDVAGEPQQQIEREGTFELRQMDLRNGDEPRRRTLVDEQRALEREERFDLSSGPLIRGRLLRLADEPLPRTSTGKVDRRRVSHALADRP